MSLRAPASSMLGRTTLDATLLPGEFAARGYRRLAVSPGEPTTSRNDLGGARLSGHLRPLVGFVQISDLHVMDHQSPARAEFLDRLGDLDSPLAFGVGQNRTYRAQEALTYQVVQAMCQSITHLSSGPVTGAALSFAVCTGDATDNCQSNELEGYVALLNGHQRVTPDSGDYSRHEGIGSPEFYDQRYWHPDGTPTGAQDDLPRARHGFPLVPGLLDACRVPFEGDGLSLPWYAVYGNHDALAGGIFAPDERLAHLVLSDRKLVGLASGERLASLIAEQVSGGTPLLWDQFPPSFQQVTSDPARRLTSKREWIAAHLFGGKPLGHGFDDDADEHERAYYRFDDSDVTFLVLDTVNNAGGYQGSIDAEQFVWLEAQLISGHRRFLEHGKTTEHDVEDRLFVLLSHHRLQDLVNDYDPNGKLRHLRQDVAALLARFANVICWVNGHSHIHGVDALAHDRDGASAGLWQITTGSHIDWPQQSRIIEIARDREGQLVITATVFDHAGSVDPRQGDLDDLATLAGWSRELAANAWQSRASAAEPIGRGAARDRNVALIVPDPIGIAR